MVWFLYSQALKKDPCPMLLGGKAWSSLFLLPLLLAAYEPARLSAGVRALSAPDPFSLPLCRFLFSCSPVARILLLLFPTSLKSFSLMRASAAICASPSFPAPVRAASWVLQDLCSTILPRIPAWGGEQRQLHQHPTSPPASAGLQFQRCLGAQLPSPTRTQWHLAWLQLREAQRDSFENAVVRGLWEGPPFVL